MEKLDGLKHLYQEKAEQLEELLSGAAEELKQAVNNIRTKAVMIKEKQLAVVNEIKDELATFLDGIKGRFDPSKVEEATVKINEIKAGSEVE